MEVNRLNPVQKATYFLKKSKVGKNEECTVTVKTATEIKPPYNNQVLIKMLHKSSVARFPTN